MKDATIWGIHGGKTGDADSLFLTKNVIAIGWKAFGDLSQIGDREDFKTHYQKTYLEAKPGAVPTNAGQLYRFVHELKQGDLVAYPSKGARRIHIGRVTGPYVYRPDVNDGYPNQRTVEWLKDFPRTNFSQGALYEIGAAMSIFKIKTYAAEFKSLLEGKSLPAEEKSDATVTLVTQDIQEQTRDFVLKQLSQNLKGLPLEEFVVHLLEKMGYRARLTPTNEPSVDIIAHKDELGFPPLVKVQVKSGDGNVDDRDVSALTGKLGPNEFALLITLSDFTSAAKQFGRSKSNLRLIDGTELVDLIFEYYERFDSKFKAIIPLKKVFVPEALEQE